MAGMQHTYDRCEKCIIFVIGLPAGKRTVEIFHIDVRIILKQTPKELCWEYRLVLGLE
jgi:hypothetical protein